MDERAAKKLWVEQWKVAGPLLEKVEHDELRAFSFQRDWQVVDGLLQLGADAPNTKPRDQSGLVEQQRIFSKARR